MLIVDASRGNQPEHPRYRYFGCKVKGLCDKLSIMGNITFEKFNLSKYANCLIVTDGKIAELYNISGNNVHLLPQGERAKSFKHIEALCSCFLNKCLTAKDTVVAVGGGSIGDTVGFATSIYKRGVNILHVPTTLIAQIDSSIGGKTAINLDGVKNAVGTYHFGDTLIDVDFLNTLDESQLRSGHGELIKYRMLSKDVNDVYDNGSGSLTDVIRACVNYKRNICQIDPFCQNERNKLNFGHTIGHALELGNNLPHGVAVANGIFYETKLASKLGKCSQQYADKWMSEIKDKFTIYPLNKEILALTLNDKKNIHNKVCFVLPDKFSQAQLTIDEVEELLLHA